MVVVGHLVGCLVTMMSSFPQMQITRLQLPAKNPGATFSNSGKVY